MRNKKLFKSAVIITASLFLFTGCGKKAEPVNAEPTETVSETDTEESEESMESMESTEPTPSPTVESTEEPVEESSSNEESEIDTSEEEEVEQTESESTGIEIVEELDITLYAQQNCNGRDGDGTNYNKVASIEKSAPLHVTGRTSNDWYRVEWGDGVIYVAGSLLGDKAPATQSSGGSGSGGNGGGGSSQQPSGGGESSQPSGGGSTGGRPSQSDIDAIFGGNSGGATYDPDGTHGGLKMPGQ